MIIFFLTILSILTIILIIIYIRDYLYGKQKLERLLGGDVIHDKSKNRLLRVVEIPIQEPIKQPNYSEK